MSPSAGRRTAAWCVRASLVALLAACGAVVTDATGTPLVVTPTADALACTLGDTLALTLAVTGGDAATPTIAFTPSDTNVVVTPSATGIGAAIRCAGVGRSTIAYRVTSGRAVVSGAVGVTIAAPPPLAVTLTPREVACWVGETVPVEARVDAGGIGAVTAPRITLAAGDPGVSVAMGTTTGVVGTATVRCLTAGRSTVSASATEGRRTGSATLPVTATTAPPVAIAALPSVLQCVAGRHARLAAAASGGFGLMRVGYEASDARIVVTADSAGADVACLTAGSAEVRVTAENAGGSARATVPVTVAPALVVAPSAASVACAPGQSVRLTLATSGGLGATTFAFAASNALVTVTSADSVATIACAASGASSVRYSVTRGDETVQGSVPIAVQAPPLSASATPSRASCWSGQATTVAVTASGGSVAPTITFDASGAVTVDPADVHTTATGAVATVRCRFGSSGSVEWTARSGLAAVTGSVPVTVTNPYFSVAPNPTSVWMPTTTSADLGIDVALAPGAPAGTSTATVLSAGMPGLLSVTPLGNNAYRLTSLGPQGTGVLRFRLAALPEIEIGVPVTVGGLFARIRLVSIDVLVPPDTYRQADLTHVSETLYAQLELQLSVLVADAVSCRLGSWQSVQTFTGPTSGRTGDLTRRVAVALPPVDGVYAFSCTVSYHNAATLEEGTMTNSLSQPLIVQRP